jgi:hypothetical protein
MNGDWLKLPPDGLRRCDSRALDAVLSSSTACQGRRDAKGQGHGSMRGTANTARANELFPGICA